MNEHLDDMMKKGLENLESRVPSDMFAHIRTKLAALDQSFDQDIQSKVDAVESPVPSGLFDGVQESILAGEHAFDAAILTAVGYLPSEVPNNLFDKITSTIAADDQQFDNLMRAKLTPFASTVPDDTWERIQNDKRKRRPVAWWWAAAAILLLAGGFGLMKALQQKSSGETGEQRIIDERGKNNASKDDRSTTTLNKDTSLTDATHPISNGDVEASRNQSKDTAVQTDENAQINSTAKNTTSSAKNPAVKKQRVPKDGSQSSVSRKNKNVRNWDRSNVDENILADGEKVRSPNNEDVTYKIATDFEASTIIAERQLAVRNRIYGIAGQKLSAKQITSIHYKKPEIPCPNNGGGKNDWSIEVYASPTMAFKRLENKPFGMDAKIGMDSTLHRQVSFNAGFNLVKNIGEDFLVKAGLQYNQTNEVLRSTRVNEIKLITTISVRTVIIAPGDTVYIRDTSITQQIGTASRQFQNKYQSWDIPVIFGYGFGGENIRFNANLGIIANIRSSYVGEMIDSSQQSFAIGSYKNKGLYKSNIGLGLYAGFGILKRFNDRMDLLIEPHARINLGNMATDAAWFKQKNIVAGLSLGIRYKLNGSRQR